MLKAVKVKNFLRNVLEEKYMKCNSEQKNAKVAKLLNHSKAHKSVLKHASCVKACISELKHKKMCNSTQKCAKSCKCA